MTYIKVLSDLPDKSIRIEYIKRVDGTIPDIESMQVHYNEQYIDPGIVYSIQEISEDKMNLELGIKKTQMDDLDFGPDWFWVLIAGLITLLVVSILVGGWVLIFN